MANLFNKSKPVGEGVPSPIGPEALARSAADAVQAYLATPLQQQADWQEKLNAPFQKLLVKAKPTEAEIRAAQKAYRTAFTEVTKEVELAGKEMIPPLLLPGPSSVEDLSILSDDPLPLADISGGSVPLGNRLSVRVSVASHIFEPGNLHQDGRNSFSLVTSGRAPANAPFFGGVSAATANGALFLHNGIQTDPAPGAPPATMKIWAGVGALLIPQTEKGWLRIRTVFTYSGTGTISLPPWSTYPLNVRADNIFKIRMVVMSTPVSNTQWRTEQDRTFDILSQGWTGAGGRGIGGIGVFGLRGDQELLVTFDRAGGPPRIYALWVLGEDEAICGSRPEVINSVDIAMNCTVGVIRVDELVRRFIFF